MRIALDLREACRPRRTGKGQWTYGFVRELLTRGIPLHIYTDVPPPPELDTGETNLFPSRGLAWHMRVARDIRRRKVADVYVSPTSYIVPALLGKSFPTVPVVHDLIAFRGEAHDGRATVIEKMTLRRAVTGASKVLTVSESTKRDLLARYSHLDAGKIVAAFAGPHDAVPPPNVPDSRTILSIGTLCPRKNQLRLIEAYARLEPRLRDRFRLLLVGGRGWKDEEIVKRAREVPGVEWRGYASDEEYVDLLRSCTLFALPSLFEGFGMQILDALQRGIPVLTSRRGSLSEVCGNAAHYVDPENVGSITEGLSLLLKNERLRFDLSHAAAAQAAKFSWRRTVDLFLEAIVG